MWRRFESAKNGTDLCHHAKVGGAGTLPPTGGEKFRDNLTTDNVFAWDYRCSFRFDLYNIICV